MLSEQEIDELVRKYINDLLDDDLRMRLENPKLYQIDDSEDDSEHDDWVRSMQGDPNYHDWMRYNIRGEMMERRGKAEHQLVNYDFSEVRQEAEKILADADVEDIAPNSLVFNRICQRLLQYYVRYWEIIADRVMGSHLKKLFVSRDHMI